MRFQFLCYLEFNVGHTLFPVPFPKHRLDKTVKGNGLTKTSLIIVGGCMGDDYMRSLLYHPHFTTEFRQAKPETK